MLQYLIPEMKKIFLKAILGYTENIETSRILFIGLGGAYTGKVSGLGIYANKVSGISAAGGYGQPSSLKQGNAAGLYDNKNYAIIRKIENVEPESYNYL